ncbi:MAG: hypothetical protein H6621_02860 [Halobacteriovoraceae bacterium]|nr:hypothetical protein [Halobacteriovoraceae bacterium]MCB9093985.1 hypothetical protein [Halobacteriovoraceae bacterium]
MKIFISLFIFFSFINVFAQDQKEETQNSEEVEFNELKDVLKNDQLLESYKKKQKIKKQVEKKRKKIEEAKKIQYPTNDIFWQIASEHWLVKNAQKLKWDFDKPSYGIGVNFKKTLVELGFIEKKIKILLIKNTNITHFALPSSKDEYIFVLSVPFIHSMDLSKREISMLLLEDLLRSNNSYFKDNLKKASFIPLIGTEIEKDQKLQMKSYNELIGMYSDVIFKKGFNFQQQFEITRKMDELLKPYKDYWNAYYSLCQKRNQLVSSNALYKFYNGIYPSTVMQLSWLKPTEKKLQ